MLCVLEEFKMKKLLTALAFFVLAARLVNAEVFMCGQETNVVKITKDFLYLNYGVDQAYFEVDGDGNHFISYNQDMSSKVKCKNYSDHARFFRRSQNLIQDKQSYFLATCNMNDPLLSDAGVREWYDVIFFATDIQSSYSMQVTGGIYHSYIECTSLDN